MRLVHDVDNEDLDMAEETEIYRDGRLLKMMLIVFGLFLGVAIVFGLSSRVIMPALKDSGIRAQGAGSGSMLNLGGSGTAKQVPNALTYRADGSGHFFIDAMVNGVPVRFMVDTGATLVALTPDDALAAGIAHSSLRFSETVDTANGAAKVARTSLREIRLGQLSVEEVPAVVMERPMPVSLLGMSFLSRLSGYSIRDGVLTINW